MDAIIGTMAIDKITESVAKALAGRSENYFKDISTTPVYGKSVS